MAPRRDEHTQGASEAWHSLAPSVVCERLGSGPEGLSEAEASRIRSRIGPNRLESTPPRPAWSLLVDQFRSVVVLLLAVAALGSLVVGDQIDSAAIVLVLVLNAALGFATEWRARREMEALLGLEVNRARVRRPSVAASDSQPEPPPSGHPWHLIEVPASELVPGDVVELEEGDGVPADVRLLEAVELTLVEAPLTGESVPVKKLVQAEPPLDVDTPLPDRDTMAWLGTTVARGRGVGVVVATGSATQVGRIGTLVKGIQDEETPLERRLDTLGRRLAAAAISVAGLVGLLGWLRGWDPAELVEASLALAVAAVPEGLPAVATITLAVGLRRMARRNALIRRLPAVEALGSATVVCTDKTGTLTRGRMEVVDHWSPAGIDDEVGYRAALLGTRAHIDFETPSDSEWQATGDPTEAALVAWALQAAPQPASQPDRESDGEPDRRARCTERWPLLDEIPFTSERRFAASLHGGVSGEHLGVMRGAPEAVLERCRLTVEQREAARARNEEMAARGLRVLALADFGDGPEAPAPTSVAGDWSPPEQGWRLLALVGIEDPPAPGVHETIQAFHRAGVETVMITGDQASTGRAIARALGMDEDRVHARVSPEEKLRLVEDLRARGEVVAMLGDGVNDAAALRRADVGVAMGRRGTSVAREMADVILLDDRFPTLAVAVREGRVIYDNIRKFVFYLFSCNLAEIFVLLGAALVGWPLPLLPLQILWLNLVTDTFPALALAFEPAGPDVMERGPRAPESELLSHRGIRSVAFYAALIAGSTLAAFVGLGGVHGATPGPIELERARTLTFTALAMAQLFHLGNARGVHRTMWHRRDLLSNPWALGALALCLALQVGAVQLPALQRLLGTVALDLRDWAWVVGLALIPAVVGQLLRAWRYRDAAV
jgi:Ca2+-transporting ATPase